MRISVDELIKRLTALNIDHQEVTVMIKTEFAVNGVTSAVVQPLEDFQFGIGGHSLILIAKKG